MQPLTDPNKIRTATTYNIAADYFDDDALSFWYKFGSATIRNLHLRPGNTVLDVACGTGLRQYPPQ